MPAKNADSYSYGDILYGDRASPEAKRAMKKATKKGKRSPGERKRAYFSDAERPSGVSPLDGRAKRMEEPSAVRNNRVQSQMKRKPR
jgi:hypothetical protein